MWTLVKMIVGAVILGFLAYGFFGVDLGGRSMAAHVADLWRAPVVQEKFELVREGVKEKIEDRLAESGRIVGRKTTDVSGITGSDGLTEADRQALSEVLNNVHTQKR